MNSSEFYIFSDVNRYNKLKELGLTFLSELRNTFISPDFTKAFNNVSSISEESAFTFYYLGQYFRTQLEFRIEGMNLPDYAYLSIYSIPRKSKAPDKFIMNYKYDKLGNLNDHYIQNDFVAPFIKDFIIKVRVELFNKEEPLIIR